MAIGKLNCLSLFIGLAILPPFASADSQGYIQLPGHTLPAGATVGARELPAPTNPLIPLAVRLQMRNEDELGQFLEAVQNPADASYGKYLTPSEFADQFGANKGDLRKVVRFFKKMGCTTGKESPDRLLLDFTCPQSSLEQGLKIKISHWVTTRNEQIQTINTDPTVPKNLPLLAINGLTSVPRHPRLVQLEPGQSAFAGSGPQGGLSPSDIRTAYNLTGVSETGTGQTLALFELDGYSMIDVDAYRSNFGISGPPLQNVLVDGFNGSAGQGAIEVVLDIDLMSAIAPAAKTIVVYEGPNSDAGLVDTYQRIANDDQARQVSTSWGASESQITRAIMNSENQIFKQMAAQGQTIYAASGDSGAFDDGSALSVDDPAAQPFMTGVGGTHLTTNVDHTYLKESTWWSSANKSGGGGGISSVWSIPSYQNGVISSASGGSTTKRNVPDVALDADPATGYSISFTGQWGVVGGTSCGAPLWAAFTALANERRSASGFAPLGQANPLLYQIAQSAGGFHDAADGSTNGHWVAVAGYDLATGWGSLDAANLIGSLATAVTPSPSPGPSPSPSPSPKPAPGCAKTNTPLTGAQTTGAALSMSLPFGTAFVSTRRRKKKRQQS